MVALAAMSGVFASAKDSAPPNNKAPNGPPRLIWGKIVDGVQSRIWLRQKTFRLNRPILVRYEFRNASRETKLIYHCGFWPNHQIELKSAAGKEVPPTDYGKEVFDKFDPMGRRETNVPVPMVRGHFDADWPTVDLHTIFKLDEPGEYTVAYVYHQGPHVIRSNTLRFVVER
jgi:hypothetical protein